ncbi:MAG: ArsC/Spx/MgsR family protein [Paracoccaceae bacterium]
MKLYGLKNCDTCRKAMKALPQAELVDVRSDGVPADVLKAALDKFGDALVNTRSTTWRGLDDTARASDPLQLLETHPALMKRPLIDVDGELHLGWTKATQDALV